MNTSHKIQILKLKKKIDKQINYEIKNNIHKVKTYKNFLKMFLIMQKK